MNTTSTGPSGLGWVLSDRTEEPFLVLRDSEGRRFYFDREEASAIAVALAQVVDDPDEKAWVAQEWSRAEAKPNPEPDDDMVKCEGCEALVRLDVARWDREATALCPECWAVCPRVIDTEDDGDA